VPFGDLGAVERAVDDETAAVCMETIPATAGYIVPDDDFWPGVRAMVGPSQAISCCGATPISFTVASITPSHSPRQPACAARPPTRLVMHRQAIRRHDYAHSAAMACDAGIGLNTAASCVRIGNDGTVYLFQPHLFARHERCEQLTIAVHSHGVVTHVQA
jgi:hypothetical protein